MDNLVYLVGFIVTMGLATFVTRAAPFILFYKNGDHPFLVYLGRYLPPAIMLLLLIYCVKDVDWFVDGQGIHELLALAIVTVTHLLMRNAMVSILLGTSVFMLLKQGLI